MTNQKLIFADSLFAFSMKVKQTA